MQIIPSQSFGYTAGAKNRENGTTPYHASLVLGGYGASRFVAISVVFAVDPDHHLVVGLAGLTTSVNSIDLLNGTNIDLHIDSNVGEIWLPVNVCKASEEAFGLIYDEDTALYLVENILYQCL
ncbi:eukaryotic aspartyl protease [Stagonosporopsis vannaccii]|nr:eukaryotic aspartyl protease [Stagonosporopsis vannaccii]